MIVADTDVLIDFVGGDAPVSERVAAEIERGNMCTTAITRFELLSGAKGKRQQASLLELLDALAILALNSEAADRAAQVRRTLENRGVPIGMADCLIAGIVLVHQGTLWTRNRKHFERVEGISLGDL